ncbi:hypothetical protein [Streptomyces erythrochromogenes]|uniref:hypothetical protein n=1 Tax=Streptomyces erythrochromogenes TaxID=285574 RepID=UPI0037FA5B6E
MEETKMAGPREQLRLAKEAFGVVVGERSDTPALRSAPTCEDLYTAAAVLTWFAVQAALGTGDYTFYLQAADVFINAATAQGCSQV